MGRLHFSDQKEENNLADKNLKARIVNKNGTSAEWEKATSFVPKKGELILYTDLNKIKIGDGVTKVNDLPFLTVPNKTSDLTNDSGYITNTSVDTKLNDKVSKAGDTMTGMLGVNLSAYPGSGGIVFGVNAPSELAVLEPSITGASGVNNSIDLVAKTVCIGHLSGDDETVRVQFNETENLIQNGLTFLNSERLKKGTVSETNDGLALSAENGTCVKVGAQAVTVCDSAGGTSQIKGVKAPVNDTDAANKKYVDDAIPTAQIEKLSSAVAKAEPFFVEVTIVSDGNHTINKTFSEIKAAYDAGRICYLRTTNQGALAQLIGITGLDTSREAIFVCVDPSNLELTTGAFIVAEEDNSVTLTIFKSQRIIEATGLLKGSGNGTITAAVAGTDYAAADHTHDTYTATEIDAMWNAVTIS